MKTPDITPAQVLAALGAIVAELAAATVIDGRLASLLTGLAGIVVPFGWLIADAIIRHGRSRLPVAASVHADVTPADFTRNGDGSWTRTRDGARGSFGPGGFVTVGS